MIGSPGSGPGGVAADLTLTGRAALLVAFLGLTALLALAAATASPAAAQVVVGELVERESGSPIAGAFVFLVDGAGEGLAGTMTRADGRFRLDARRARGQVRLRAEQIGYTTSESEPIEVPAQGSVAYRFEVDARPLALEGIVVEGARRCEVRPEQGRAVARLWEEASKALRATAITEAEEALSYVARYRTQQLDARTLAVRQEASEEKVLVAAVPFRSVSPDVMIERGFVHEDGNELVFYAPDSALLLSDAFLDTHCLRLARPSPDHPGWVGLEFEPVPGRSLPEIRGAVWLDAGTAELRRLEYGYTGRLPFNLGRRHAGGMVEFDRLPTGAWIVRDWWIRMPRATFGVRGPRLHDYLLRGARIIEVRDADGQLVFLDADESGS
jgi:hypothetical protein